jgi:hypothetical protein
MRKLLKPILAYAIFIIPTYAHAQGAIFLIKDSRDKQWCSFNNEVGWNNSLNDTRIRTSTSGVLTYSNDRISTMDFVITDELSQPSEWTIRDHYFLDDTENIIKLSRTIEIFATGKKVSETFSIMNGKATLIEPKPKLTFQQPKVQTNVKTLPFRLLLENPNLKSSNQLCVRSFGE